MKNPLKSLPTGKKKVLIILLILFLISCCCTMSIGAGVAYFWQRKEVDGDSHGKAEDNQPDDDQEDTSSTDIEEEEDQQESDDTSDQQENDEQDDSGDSSTGSGQGEDETLTQPQISVVIAEMDQVQSYRIHVELSGSSGETLDAEYQAPNREYVMSNDGEVVTEEIAIGDKVYSRVQGGTWTIQDYPSLTGFHNDLLDLFGDEFFVFEQGGLEGNYWVYSFEEEGTGVELLVDRDTNLIYKMLVLEGGIEIGYFEYKDYNDPEIQIQAPI